jgi:hypothetical protein
MLSVMCGGYIRDKSYRGIKIAGIKSTRTTVYRDKMFGIQT